MRGPRTAEVGLGARAAAHARGALPGWAWALPVAAAVAGSIAWSREMTYLQFHLAFTLPWVALLAVAAVRAWSAGAPVAGDLGGGVRGNRFAAWALALHAVVAFLYTTPWDNYLVFRAAWGYPEGRVLGTVGFVPVEEYAFFVIQTVLTGLALFALARARGALQHAAAPRVRALVERVVGVALLLSIAGAGVVALGSDRSTYLGLILVWAVPVLALQWAFGGDLLLRRWRVLVPAVALPTVYLWVADRFAIAWGIWWISPDLTLGWRPFGLPVEEAVFFLVTNLLVAFGLVLALHPRSGARLREIARAARGLHRPLLMLWAITMVPTPLVPEAFAPLAYVSTSLLALAVLAYALRRFGRVAVTLFAVAFGFGLAIEWVGAATGVPFGAYSYHAPGPALLGVPLLVPLGWWAFTLIAIAVAPPGRALLVAPLALVAWDLALDPLMVQQGFWSFEHGGAYLGVPVSNFVGWYLSGLVLTWLLLRLEPRLRDEVSPDLRGVFLAQTFLIGVGLVAFGLPLATLVSVPAMLLLASTWWWWRTA